MLLKIDNKTVSFNWNNILNMGNSIEKEHESLLARTSREFWCDDNIALYGSTMVSETFGDGKASESSTLVPTSLEEV